MRTLVCLGMILLAGGQACAQSKTLMPGDTGEILAPTWACIESISKRLDAVLPDRKAFEKIIFGAARTGECVEMKKGTKIYVEEVWLADGKTKLRIEGTETFRLAKTAVLDETAKRTGNIYKKK